MLCIRELTSICWDRIHFYYVKTSTKNRDANDYVDLGVFCLVGFRGILFPFLTVFLAGRWVSKGVPKGQVQLGKFFFRANQELVGRKN